MPVRTATLLALVTATVLALPSAAVAGGAPLATDLTGAEETAPADADATGFASLTLNQGKGTVCFDVSWADVDGTVVAGHIHQAPAGINGPVVVPLVGVNGEGTGSASGCQAVDPALVKAIKKNPSDYYVNVHSSVFPAGAVRGQLG